MRCFAMLADINTTGATQILPADNAKSKKENPPEETRTVEDISESQDSKLNVDKQNIEKRECVDNEAKGHAAESRTYDAAGNLSRSITAGGISGGQGKQIDLII
jgi:hypothetical protein